MSCAMILHLFYTSSKKVLLHVLVAKDGAVVARK